MQKKQKRPVAHPDVAQTRCMLKRLSGELLGTFVLVFCGTGAIVINQESGGQVTHIGIAITFGLVVMVMILSLGHISGAHMNPAVSVALYVAKRFKLSDVVPYISAQLVGAILASTILHILFPKNELLGASLPSGSDWQSFFLEFLLTFILMMVILTSTMKKNHSLLGPALAIGGTVGLEALFAGPICGASMNPARSLSPAIIGNHYQSIWVYLLGPVLGALAATFLFVVLKEDDCR